MNALMADLEGEDVAAEANLSAVPVDFCDAWPVVRQGLEYLSGLLGGGWSSVIVRWAVSQLINVGNRACSGA